MNLTKSLWIRNTAIVTAVIAYLLLSTAIVVGQSSSKPKGQVPKTVSAKILISGKVVNQAESTVPAPEPIARIILPPDSRDQRRPADQPKPTTASPANLNPPPAVQEPKRQLARPVRPTVGPYRTNWNRSLAKQSPTPGSPQPNLLPATNSTLVQVPNVSPRMENPGEVNRNIDRSATSTLSGRPEDGSPSNVSGAGSHSAIRISELPSIEKVSGEFSPGSARANQAVFYPSTEGRFQVTPVNGSSKTSRQDGDVETRFQDRDHFNMLQPLMPRPVQVPGEKDQSNQRRAIDPRIEKFLSSGEFLRDGGDRKLQVVVGSDWSVQGLDTEDTVGHFDTLDGQRIVVPSNRVSIYAPRFAAVQRVSGLKSADAVDRMVHVNDTTPAFQSGSFDFAANSKQHVGTVRNIGRKSATALQDRTRGLTVDNSTTVASTDSAFTAQKIHQFLLTGYIGNSEKAFLATAMQSAITWSSDMEVKIVVKNLEPKLVHEVKSANETITIDPRGRKSKLRVVKMADKRTAQPGEIVEFMIRFDNVGEDLIGNVTVIDNLTTRLEYVEGSANCSIKADLITSQNDAQSTQLRWEIVDPLKIGTGGVIKFKCRVR